MIAAEHAIASIPNYIHPIDDPRWDRFVKRHPCSSIFHTVEWLEALRRTYGYEPIVITTSPAGSDLRNGVVLCRVDSWLTGHRLVSLPFSDHCDALVDEEAEADAMLSELEDRLRREKLLYVELRPMRAFTAGIDRFQSICQHYLHRLDLTPDLDILFCNCHKNSTQRKIQRAKREGLGYEEGQSKSLLDIFYRLQQMTRRRHQLPPQPRSWFQNLIDCFGDSLKIRVALKGTQPVASILTITHKKTLVYKYGCSDGHFRELGGIHLLLWRSIEEAKQQGFREMDLGRSDCENLGLATFKRRWGSARSTLHYYRFSASDQGHFLPASDWKQTIAKRVFSRLPQPVLTSVGQMMYKHIG
jgi:CelD/BcsL family acetyltransferase involved in cellulose biosynthesis